MLLNLLFTTALLGTSLKSETLKSDRAMNCYVTLMAQAGWGRRADERGAFLVDGSEGIECREWPSTHGHMRATFRGAIPAGTLAIVHTHPIGNPDPSGGDITEAKRLRVPILVVTPNALSLTERGKVHQVAKGFGWFERVANEPAGFRKEGVEGEKRRSWSRR